MRLFEIPKLPTTISKIHESVFRCYHILNLARELLDRGTPGDVVVDIIDAMMLLPPLEQDLSEICARKIPAKGE